MVRPLSPPSNEVDEQSDSGPEEEEEIICTHHTGGDGGEPQPPPPQNASTSQDTSLGAGDVARAGLAAGAAGVAVPTAATAGLTAVGFTSSGVAAGSMAAGIQAGIGNVVAGSAFATAQSIGATGGFAILGPLGLGAAIVGGTAYLGVRMWRKNRRRRREEEEASRNLPGDNDDNGGGGGETEEKPLCPECRKKLLLRISRRYFKGKVVENVVKNLQN